MHPYKFLCHSPPHLPASTIHHPPLPSSSLNPAEHQKKTKVGIPWSAETLSKSSLEREVEWKCIGVFDLWSEAPFYSARWWLWKDSFLNACIDDGTIEFCVNEEMMAFKEK